jgi:dTMP kinase
MAFIVIEGLDGAGKSTQVQLLTQFFKTQNKKVEFFHFPTSDSPIFGNLIARFLRGEFGKLDNVNPYLVALIFAGDRYNMSENIKRWLADDKIVITDRYVYSNIAFQGAKMDTEDAQNELENWILDLEFNYFKIQKPDISIFLNVPFKFTEKNLFSRRVGNDRQYLQGAEDIHENDLIFQKNVRKMYEKMVAKDVNFEKIDCFDNNNEMLKPEQISVKIIELLQNKQKVF